MDVEHQNSSSDGNLSFRSRSGGKLKLQIVGQLFLQNADRVEKRQVAEFADFRILSQVGRFDRLVAGLLDVDLAAELFLSILDRLQLSVVHQPVTVESVCDGLRVLGRTGRIDGGLSWGRMICALYCGW